MQLERTPMLPRPPGPQRIPSPTSKSQLFTSNETSSLGRFFDAAKGANTFSGSPPRPPSHAPLNGLTSTMLPSSSVDMSEEARQQRMKQQVADLESWCEMNKIVTGISHSPVTLAPSALHQPIPSTSTLPPTPLPNPVPVSLPVPRPIPVPHPTPSTSTARPLPTASLPPRPSIKRQRSKKVKLEEGDEEYSTSAGPSAAPRLLTDAERRANHIASEQKRRAAIREGASFLRH